MKSLDQMYLEHPEIFVKGLKIRCEFNGFVKDYFLERTEPKTRGYSGRCYYLLNAPGDYLDQKILGYINYIDGFSDRANCAWAVVEIEGFEI